MARIRMLRRRRAKPPTARARREEQAQRKLDDALRDSFPASDPVSFLQPGPADEVPPEFRRERKQRRRA